MGGVMHAIARKKAMTTCTCKYCSDHREVEVIKERGDVEEMRKLITHLEDRADHAEMERDYCKAVIDGSWPEADAQIAEARKWRSFSIRECGSLSQPSTHS